MKTDDPKKPAFASIWSYRRFAQHVRHKRRYAWDGNATAFIATVLATMKGRECELPEGMVLYRAQRGVDELTSDDGLPEGVIGYSAHRMKPRSNRAAEGRANPSGISVLYLGTEERTVISEVRPWVGAEISVAQFRLNRQLKALDLSRGHGRSSLLEFFTDAQLSPEKIEEAVWIDIDNAFSEPVTKSDDAADYVPTQILAEIFANAGYDAIIYKSQFGENGFNIAVFNPDDADIINCAPYSVTGFEVSFKQSGNYWFSSKAKKTDEP